MSPIQFVKEMRDGVLLKHILTPKQVEDAQNVLDIGHQYIAKVLCRDYDDMSPEAVDSAKKLQAFLFVFIEHCHNPALLKAMNTGAEQR